LAYKKTYPALFGLYRNNFLPNNTHIIGYARSKIDFGDFKKRISSKIKLHNEKERTLLDEFLSRCSYESGSYDEGASYEKLEIACSKLESRFVHGDRVFYMALPPSVFAAVSNGIKTYVYSKTGSNRIVVEKPFGKDSESSRELSVELAKCWKEEEVL
jgi:glucose-6-phosphate 1-dehydrogenase